MQDRFPEADFYMNCRGIQSTKPLSIEDDGGSAALANSSQRWSDEQRASTRVGFAMETSMKAGF
jgi:hypothetical protein